jgi:hypothetical protein
MKDVEVKKDVEKSKMMMKKIILCLAPSTGSGNMILKSKMMMKKQILLPQDTSKYPIY